MREFKESRECWLLQEFQKALKRESSQNIMVECGEEGSGDGKLIINNEEIEVQIVTAEKTLYEKSALAEKSGLVKVYDLKPIEWIKNALKLKAEKNYSNEKELVILIDFGYLDSINKEYLLNTILKDKEIIKFAKQFRDVYILSPSDNSSFITRSNSQKEPILVKI